VLFPAFGRPTMATYPQRNSGDTSNIKPVSSISLCFG